MKYRLTISNPSGCCVAESAIQHCLSAIDGSQELPFLNGVLVDTIPDEAVLLGIAQSLPEYHLQISSHELVSANAVLAVGQMYPNSSARSLRDMGLI